MSSFASSTTMPEWLRQRAYLTPDRLALLTSDARLTFRELDDAVERVAFSLAAHGVHPGDMVALLSGNSTAFVQVVHALTRVGVVLVPLNVRLTPTEIEWQLRDSSARYLLHDRANASVATSLSRALPALQILDTYDLENARPSTSSGRTAVEDVRHSLSASALSQTPAPRNPVRGAPVEPRELATYDRVPRAGSGARPSQDPAHLEALEGDARSTNDRVSRADNTRTPNNPVRGEPVEPRELATDDRVPGSGSKTRPSQDHAHPEALEGVGRPPDDRVSRAGTTSIPPSPVRGEPVEARELATDDRVPSSGSGTRPSQNTAHPEALQGGARSPFDRASPSDTESHFARTLDLAQTQAIVYTSGTTGRPKGAMLTYGNHFWSATGSVLNLGLLPDDRWLACLPLFHVGGLSILFRSVIYGMPAVVHENFEPARVNAAIDEDHVTIVSVVSAMLQRMLAERGDRPYPSHLRCMLLGGGPAPRPLLEDCAARGVPVVQTYGLTESSSQVATLAPEDALRKLGSAGKPLFPAELRIEREDGVESAPEEPGEILVRGPSITPGYHSRPEESARALRDGWLHTGDIGYVDSDGYLYVLDRRDDLIVSGGENVYPAEIESALQSHGAVIEAGVVGVTDERWGQTPVGCVVLRPSVPATDAVQLLDFLRARLAAYKLPARLIFVSTLPRNAAGKLLRSELRSRLADGSIDSL